MDVQIQNRILNQSVLFLDPDYELVCILSSFLASQKFKVAQSKKAREAIFKMRNQKFDLIIMDPKIADEHFFFSSLIEFSNQKIKPELLITSKDLNFNIPQSLVLPIRSVLPKPFDLESFWNAVVC